VETLLSAGADGQQSVVAPLPVDDAREGARQVRAGRFPRFLTALDQAHAERLLVAQARAHHVQIAWLENAQCQRAFREQHRMQGEKRHFAHLFAAHHG
jgi:hypothetical protein